MAQKYFSEIALVMVTGGTVMFRPAQMPVLRLANSEALAVLQEASIYVIVKRPRVRVFPDSVALVGGDLTFSVIANLNQKSETVTVNVPNVILVAPDASQVKLHDHFPFLFQFLGESGNDLGTLPLEVFLGCSDLPPEAISHLEVLYIGQSFGRKGTIVDRLKNHSTLQKILSDVVSNDPDSEVFTLCFMIDPPAYLTKMDGHGNPQTTDEEDSIHWISSFQSPPTDEQVVGLMEACLIRYFQPQYNIQLRESFPSTNLRLLQSCYELDFNALIAEIDTEFAGCSLFSPTVSASIHHVAEFDLHDSSDRLSFFQFAER